MTEIPRREPPPFQPAAVRSVETRTPRLVRVVLEGPGLAALVPPEPAASIRVLLPGDDGPLVVPTWRGNEFLLPDGSRPRIRTLTPIATDDTDALAVEVVVHQGGALSAWASAAAPGDVVAVSGPGRGYAVDEHAPAYLLAGDETALPAIGQVLAALPADVPVQVLVEVADPAARLDLPAHPNAPVTWLDLPDGAPPGDALVAAVRTAELVDGVRVWAAGEAAAVQRIRRHLFEEHDIARSHATVRGYWKHGRPGT